MFAGGRQRDVLVHPFFDEAVEHATTASGRDRLRIEQCQHTLTDRLQDRGRRKQALVVCRRQLTPGTIHLWSEPAWWHPPGPGRSTKEREQMFAVAMHRSRCLAGPLPARMDKWSSGRIGQLSVDGKAAMRVAAMAIIRIVRFSDAAVPVPMRMIRGNKTGKNPGSIVHRDDEAGDPLSGSEQVFELASEFSRIHISADVAVAGKKIAGADPGRHRRWGRITDMNTITPRLLAFLILVLPLAHVVGAAETWPGWRGKARHLIIAVIDGPRWSETWGEAGTPHIPVMALQLAPQGAIYMDFRNTGKTNTNCGHTALTTGVYEEIDNKGNEFPAHPSLLQRFRDVTGQPPESTWIVSAKDKLYILGDTKSPEWKGRNVPRVDAGKPATGPFGGYRDDPETMDMALKVFTEHHPAFMIINLRQPDSSAHKKDWDGYLAGIVECDRQIGRLWAAIQADPQLRNQTDLFITNDHGRHLDGHADGYVNHSDDCEGCRHISLLAIGPDIPNGVTIATRRNQIDLAVTVAWLAGVDLPRSAGQRMDEVLVGATQKNVRTSVDPAPAK